jgi:hypothetical protein
MTAIFIDGPLRGEVKDGSDYGPIYRVLLPNRIIVCDCNPDYEQESEIPAGEFEYFAVAVGDGVVIYSKQKDSHEALVASLREWIVSDLTNDWHLHCRDRRAFQ